MENLEELENILTLTDENGVDADFEYLDVIEYQGSEYIVLLPIEETESECDEVIIMRIEPVNDEEENYVSIDDEDTAMAVFEIFKEKFQNEFTFVD